MPTIRVLTTDIPANGSANPLQGNQYEYLPFPARVEFAVVASAAGIDVTVYSGSDLLQQGGPASVKATPVLYPDDFLLDDVAGQGERLNVILREIAGTALTDIETVVKITPL